ncbi:unnamed protein product [Heligmosomoides polygyrus]|uniref:7TM_GPCR_Srx domain-containing protein n=1 Tax=Heligmosomoides polygyrus TaxID=6339 RepID=A0A3P7YAF7_HELPZ|nr:unnamed protein product [Heligmosomoides polygyrus]
MDDTSSTPIAASANIRYMMAFTYLILSVIGIIPNIILAITLYKLGSMPKQNVFVLLAKQILISDFCQLSSQLFVAFPLALYGRNIYEGSAAIWIYNVVNFLDTVGYNGVLDFTFIMAMNRVTVFLLPKVHQAFFGGRAAMWTVVFVWSFLFMQIIVANVMRCHKQFTYEEFYFYFQCANRDALHAAIITFFLVLQTASFSLLPMIGTGNERFYSSLAQNVISILNNSANPYVYFFFNTQIREGMLSLLRCKSIPTARNLLATAMLKMTTAYIANVTVTSRILAPQIL